MKLDAFKVRAVAAGAEVEILAVDPVIYLLRVTDGDGSALLTRRRKDNWVFTSLGACQRLLQEAGIRSAVLVQDSAYGEMVGVDTEGGNSQMRMPLHIPAAERR